MKKLSSFIVKFHIPILILALLLIVPSVYGMMKTRINYDMLTYLPEDMETVKGQDILLEDFGKGAFSVIVVEGMTPGEIKDMTERLEKVEHVATAASFYSIADCSVPVEILPDKWYNMLNSGDSTLVAVFFDTSTSADETIEAIRQVRKTAGNRCFVTGMSALVTDLKDLCEKEEPIYVGLAVACAVVAMMIFMDSFIIPFIFLASMGMAILLNLGTNYWLGEISYITKALSAVLQLAVTMDYSIFLWNCYSEQKVRFPGDNKRAMKHAISNTFTSVIGSSLTTVAGFIALCFMSFTLGKDLGIVMAKGVALGVIGSITTLPALILVFDGLIEKTKHRSLMPKKMDKVAKVVTSKPAVFIAIFLIVLFPALYGYVHTEKYYDMSNVLPESIDFVTANRKLEKEFNMASTHMVLSDAKMDSADAKDMLDELEEIKGVKFAVGLESVLGSGVPEEFLPESVLETLKSDRYSLTVISSEYYVGSEEVDKQIDEINAVIKKWDKDAMLIGEAPCTKDMVSVTDTDFTRVSIISIAAIFLIIAVVTKSVSLPVVLVAVIEFAIFINLGIPYYLNTSLPFIAPICISTIQLGATVDYAILMTNGYKKQRSKGEGKKEAVSKALSSAIPSIFVSAMGFFAATFGVAMYSDLDIISSMCGLMARGAIISMFAVVLILPAFLSAFDGVISHSTIGMRKIAQNNQLQRKER
ncbi:MAG: MMPL family transporter [Lachnospiraceae bacterium]|nr:MMPL family transporter [Lachnospiraceae bacterium]